MPEIDDWMFSLRTDVGWFKVEGNSYFVTSAQFVFEQPPADFGQGSLKTRCRQQLQQYFAHELSEFDLPVMTCGTDFQQKTWMQLESIPFGETRTYKDVASAITSSPRAVGGACRHNPIAVIVPCHRVVSVSGVGGYAGDSAGQNLRVKNWLLEHESAR